MDTKTLRFKVGDKVIISHDNDDVSWNGHTGTIRKVGYQSWDYQIHDDVADMNIEYNDDELEPASPVAAPTSAANDVTVADVLSIIDSEIARYDSYYKRGNDNPQSLVLELLKTKILEAKVAAVDATPAVGNEADAERRRFGGLIDDKGSAIICVVPDCHRQASRRIDAGPVCKFHEAYQMPTVKLPSQHAAVPAAVHPYQPIVDAARKVALAKGEQSIGWNSACSSAGKDFLDSYHYKDEIVEIYASPVNQAVSIERRENRNPVISTTAEGKFIRQHGETTYIKQHVLDLAVSLDKPAPEPTTKSVKLTAANSPLCAKVKQTYNAQVYRVFLRKVNSEPVYSAIRWLVQVYVSPEHHAEKTAEYERLTR